MFLLPGLNRGSVVGLAKELQKMSFGAANPIYHSRSAPNGIDASTSDQAGLVEPLGAMDPYLEDVPGVIVLNPGKLVSSECSSRAMSTNRLS